MTLNSGTKLGHYEIVESIGAGGMGEVYRARDSKLDRDVAIKVLPDEFARDKERLERFEREARLLAQLNHPHVATIHGLDDHDGQRFLVMELVDGETLAEQISRGAIPTDEALPLFGRIAEGLQAAHDKGIIHRDLKPANIKITPDGTPKILDFGLAKAFADDTAERKDSSQSPTLTKGTAIGVILGTAGYMSPEQARGKVIDKRTDIFAFGCVLYEALTGQRAFGGETVTDTLAAVVKSEPDWAALPRETPARIKELLLRCLRKKADRRLHDIADARIEIEEAPSEPVLAPVAAVGFSRNQLALAASGVLLLGAFLGSRFVSSTIESDVPLTRASINLPEGSRFSMDNVSGVAISPDGSHVVYLADVENGVRIFVQPMDSMEPRPIETASDAVMPFFSPDSQWLGFETATELKKVALSGGAPVTVAKVAAWSSPRGASWGPDDTIVFAPYGSGGLSRVPADGGAVDVLTVAKMDEGEKGHRFPHVLPGGEALLFTIARSDIESFDDAAIAVLSIDTGEYRVIVEGGSRAIYVDSGHLLYSRGAELLAVPFDLRSLSIQGAPAPVVTGVSTRPLFGASAFDVSRTGTLVYVSGEAFLQQNRLLWVDRGGDTVPIARAPRPFSGASHSPTNRRLAFTMQGANDSVWTYDLDRDTLNPLVTGFDSAGPLWTPDGTRIVFQSNRTGHYGIYWVRSDGTGTVEPLTSSDYERFAASITPDGQTLLFGENHRETGWDIWTLSLGEQREAVPLLQTKSNETRPIVSPDGHWLAYVSDESGQDEVYVQPFPGPGRRWQVSTAGGVNPLWNPTGGELFYRSRGRTMVVDVTGTDELDFARPRVLFETPQTSDRQPHGISPDGQRFAMVFQEPRPVVEELRLVFNWTEELKRLVPTEN